MNTTDMNRRQNAVMATVSIDGGVLPGADTDTRLIALVRALSAKLDSIQATVDAIADAVGVASGNTDVRG